MSGKCGGRVGRELDDIFVVYYYSLYSCTTTLLREIELNKRWIRNKNKTMWEWRKCVRRESHAVFRLAPLWYVRARTRVAPESRSSWFGSAGKKRTVV